MLTPSTVTKKMKTPRISSGHSFDAWDPPAKEQFLNFLQADSTADKWYEELADADRKDWEAKEESGKEYNGGV